MAHAYDNFWYYRIVMKPRLLLREKWVSPSTVSNLNKKIYAKIEAWRNRRIEGEHPYLYLDGIVMKRTWAGEVRNVSLLVASAVNSEGFREILGICEGAKEDKSGWSAFLRHLVDRRPQWRATHHLRCLPRSDGKRRRVSACPMVKNGSAMRNTYERRAVRGRASLPPRALLITHRLLLHSRRSHQS